MEHIMTRYLVLFEDVYVLKFDIRDDEIVNRILDNKPNLTEFKEHMKLWKITYTLEKIGDAK